MRVLLVVGAALAAVGAADLALAIKRYAPDFVEQVSLAVSEAEAGRSPFVRTW